MMRYREEELVWNGDTSFFQLQMYTDQQFLKFLVYKSEESSGLIITVGNNANGFVLEAL